MRRVTVFAGAGGAQSRYVEAARALGAAAAERGIGVVYGGGRMGLMGALAEGALAEGGHVTGVIPQALVDREMVHRGLSRLEIVDTMHERKRRMADLGSAFVALPGGIGTLEELFEAWTWLQLGFHRKPVALLNVEGFWDPLVQMTDRQVAEGFLSPRERELLVVAEGPEGLFDRLS